VAEGILVLEEAIMSTDLKTIFEDIRNLILQGKTAEVFEKYYADDVVMQDNENPPTVGKVANRQRVQDFFAGVIEFKEPELQTVAFGEDVIISEWAEDFTHKDLGKQIYNQVSVQKWKNGKVIHERFYYGS
jgi:ketosteroid isomerase-like protein